MKSSILITGGAGYIGSHIGLLLHQHNYEIIIIDSFLHSQQIQLPWATMYRGDFADEELLSKLFSTYPIHAVIHCAASIEVGQSVRDPGLYYENNVAKTITLLRAMMRYGVRNLIFSSSAAVYGVPQESPINENHPCNPINPYGRTKLMIEEVIKDFHAAYGLNYIILRYFNVAGAWPEYNLGEHHQPETHLIPLVLQAVREKKPFTIFGNKYDTKDGNALRDYVHVRDIAQAHLCALAHLGKNLPSDTFNIGSGQGKTILEVVENVQQLCGKKISIKYAPERAGDPPSLVANIDKVKNIVRWQPQFSALEFIIQSIVL